MMRSLTYVLGAITGFFTFGGIGLIVRSYQIEGGVTLVIGLFSFIQFIRFLKEDYLMEKNQDFIWYAGYGSNLSKQRFECYIKPDIPKYGRIKSDGCTDKTLPSGEHPYIIKHRLYFAHPTGESTSNWGKGGVAFIDPSEEKDENHWTKGRIWKIKKEQFREIKEQEGPIWYSKEIQLDDLDGFPVITITNPKKVTRIRPPSERYLKTISEGLKETYNLSNDDIINYLMQKGGIINILTGERMMEIVESVL